MKTWPFRSSQITIISSFLLATCIPGTAFAADLARGKALFEERCASCHGLAGAGDGPVAAALPPDQQPRNLQEPTRKYATDGAKFKELLKKGGGAFGLNALMPPQPDLSEADLDSVIAYSDSLKKK